MSPTHFGTTTIISHAYISFVHDGDYPDSVSEINFAAAGKTQFTAADQHMQSQQGSKAGEFLSWLITVNTFKKLRKTLQLLTGPEMSCACICGLSTSPKPPRSRATHLHVLAPRYRLMAGYLAATVCGASPPNKPTRGRIFLLVGAEKFIRLPPACLVSPSGELSRVGSGDANYPFLRNGIYLPHATF